MSDLQATNLHDCPSPNDEICDGVFLYSVELVTGRKVAVICRCECHNTESAK